jgi:RNA polymerase sigma-70 factor (ECF subfamily)
MTPTRASATHDDDFERFFNAHEAQITGYLYRVTGDAQSASDLSQETFLRAWQHFDRIRSYERPGAWLTRVATNLALQHLRRRKAPVTR